MSDALVQRVEDLRAAGIRMFEILDRMSGTTRVRPTQAKKYSGFALAHVARCLLKQRQMRNEHFVAELFSEPAWDILLDLFIAHIEQQHVSITSACLSSAAPQTTSLRWLDVVQKLGLVERYGCTNDRRVSYVRLTKAGHGALRRYLEAVYDTMAAP
jgi:hypothetical protein